MSTDRNEINSSGPVRSTKDESRMCRTFHFIFRFKIVAIHCKRVTARVDCFQVKRLVLSKFEFLDVKKLFGFNSFVLTGRLDGFRKCTRFPKLLVK